MSTSGVTLVATPAFVAITSGEFLLLALVVVGGLCVTWFVMRLVLRETVRASGEVLPRRDRPAVDSSNAAEAGAPAALVASDGAADGAADGRDRRKQQAHASDADVSHWPAGEAHPTRPSATPAGRHHDDAGTPDPHDTGGDSSGDGGGSDAGGGDGGSSSD